MKNVKRFFMLFAVCALASSVVFALPLLGRSSSKASASDSLVELPQEDTQEASPAEEQPELLQISEETSATLSEVLKSLETASRLNKKQLDELISSLEKAQEEYDILVADIDAKEEERAELTRLNAEQADKLAKEKGTKYFANISGSVGFEGETPIYSVGGSLGVRLWKGLMISGGAEYNLGDFKDIPLVDISLDRFSFKAAVGWEW